MTDPDALRRLAANLDAEVEGRHLRLRQSDGVNTPAEDALNLGLAHAYADVAAQIRAILADEATEQEDT